MSRKTAVFSFSAVRTSDLTLSKQITSMTSELYEVMIVQLVWQQGFDYQHGQEILLFSVVLRPTLIPTLGYWSLFLQD
jgi:hypothetical protein